ncbi:uncharacterized protein LOC116842719 [Odontomachus brunneus]|uniref:uncharacterized protein LOC116842719 n=1 Tax=Odontomachus brunneus TaxID=486640 RepID=UPI0013F2A199|nr:uncharacterized protein LOC116842719 [Odontomachus brunneus]
MRKRIEEKIITRANQRTRSGAARQSSAGRPLLILEGNGSLKKVRVKTYLRECQCQCHDETSAEIDSRTLDRRRKLKWRMLDNGTTTGQQCNMYFKECEIGSV